MADVHGNLPALTAALDAIRREKCQLVFHLGDAIGIGPYPAECLQLLVDTPEVSPVMGNHEVAFVYGLQSILDGMEPGEIAHYRWVHSVIDPSMRDVVSNWPFIIHRQIEGIDITFVHYGLDASGRDFLPIVPNPSPKDLNSMFRGCSGDIVFFGHRHKCLDVVGRSRYVNPGSLGCSPEPSARFIILRADKGEYELVRRSVAYDDTALFRDFEERRVPDRELIYKAFFGRG